MNRHLPAAVEGEPLTMRCREGMERSARGIGDDGKESDPGGEVLSLRPQALKEVWALIPGFWGSRRGARRPSASF